MRVRTPLVSQSVGRGTQKVALAQGHITQQLQQQQKSSSKYEWIYLRKAGPAGVSCPSGEYGGDVVVADRRHRILTPWQPVPYTKLPSHAPRLLLWIHVGLR
jgi:hypothetical protein